MTSGGSRSSLLIQVRKGWASLDEGSNKNAKPQNPNYAYHCDDISALKIYSPIPILTSSATIFMLMYH